jgi:hypothetical protein
VFDFVEGYTGILWNQDTFHSSLVAQPEKEIDGKTINILSKSNPSILPLTTAEELLKKVAGYEALIDEGSWYRRVLQKT